MTPPRIRPLLFPAALAVTIAVALLLPRAVAAAVPEPIARDRRQQSSQPALPVPTLTAHPSAAAVELRWTELPGAASYELWIWCNEETGWQLVSDKLTGAVFTHTEATPGAACYYAVRALDANRDPVSAWSQYVPATVPASTPTPTSTPPPAQSHTASTTSAPQLTARPAPGAVELSWTELPGAAAYELWTWWDRDVGWQFISDNITGSSFTHTELTPGATYYYALRALDAAGNAGPWSNYPSAIPLPPFTPTSTPTPTPASDPAPAPTPTTTLTPTTTPDTNPGHRPGARSHPDVDPDANHHPDTNAGSNRIRPARPRTDRPARRRRDQAELETTVRRRPLRTLDLVGPRHRLAIHQRQPHRRILHPRRPDPRHNLLLRHPCPRRRRQRRPLVGLRLRNRFHRVCSNDTFADAGHRVHTIAHTDGDRVAHTVAHTVAHIVAHIDTYIHAHTDADGDAAPRPPTAPRLPRPRPLLPQIHRRRRHTRRRPLRCARRTSLSRPRHHQRHALPPSRPACNHGRQPLSRRHL